MTKPIDFNLLARSLWRVNSMSLRSLRLIDDASVKTSERVSSSLTPPNSDSVSGDSEDNSLDVAPRVSEDWVPGAK